MEVRINDSFRVMHFGRDGVGGWGGGWETLSWLEKSMVRPSNDPN